MIMLVLGFYNSNGFLRVFLSFLVDFPNQQNLQSNSGYGDQLIRAIDSQALCIVFVSIGRSPTQTEQNLQHREGFILEKNVSKNCKGKP